MMLMIWWCFFSVDDMMMFFFCWWYDDVFFCWWYDDVFFIYAFFHIFINLFKLLVDIDFRLVHFITDFRLVDRFSAFYVCACPHSSPTCKHRAVGWALMSTAAHSCLAILTSSVPLLWFFSFSTKSWSWILSQSMSLREDGFLPVANFKGAHNTLFPNHLNRSWGGIRQA